MSETWKIVFLVLILPLIALSVVGFAQLGAWAGVLAGVLAYLFIGFVIWVAAYFRCPLIIVAWLPALLSDRVRDWATE